MLNKLMNLFRNYTDVTNMIIIGLTGGIGSGKNRVCAMLKKNNYPVIDADELSHTLTKKGAPALFEIKETFGSEIITKSGELDRRKLGRLVFKDKRLLLKLEAVLHPKIE